MTDPHPFAGSSWIWQGDCRFDLVNVHLQARHEFELARVPRACELRITADARYRLWINGEHVCRGPARGYPEHWPFDRVDIAPFLRRGRNLLAVQAHSLGIGTFQYAHRGASGLIVAGRAGDVDLGTPGAWRVRRAPEQRRHLRLVSLQLGFQEEVDLRAVDGWMDAGYDASGWASPSTAPLGVMPWHAFEERGIPLLREAIAAPLARTHVAHGVALATADENPGQEWFDQPAAWSPAAVACAHEDGWALVELPASGAGGWSAVSLDCADEVVGSLELDIEGGGSGERLDVLVCEAVHPERGPLFDDPRQGCRIAFANRIHLAGGVDRCRQIDHWGFRHIVLVARGTTRPLRIRVRVRTCLYPLEVVGRLASADPRLDAIHAACVRTQQACMLDAYVDCPWREQAQWWGDARVQAFNTFHLAADARLLARGIRSIAGQEVPNGLTYGHAPTIAHSCILPDFTLTWVSTLHDHWWQTGDTGLIREQAPRLRRALAYFAGMVAKRGPAKGLLPYDARYWLFLDWCPIFKGGYPTLYNLLHLQALRHAAKLFALIGARVDAADCQRRAVACESAVGRLYRNGAWLGGLDWEGGSVTQDSPHGEALACLLDLRPKQRAASVSGLRTLCAESLDVVRPMRPSPFFMHYVLSALDAAGEGAAVVDCIRRWWGDMLDRGLVTVEEVWRSVPGNQSLCHAWSAHPLAHLARILLGVRQTAPAWKQVTIAPTFCLDAADGVVPTPHGPITVAWRRSATGVRGTVSVPRGVRATLALPGARARRLTAGKTAWTA